MIRKNLGTLALLSSLVMLTACGGSDGPAANPPTGGGSVTGDPGPGQAPAPDPAPAPAAAFTLSASIDKAVLRQGGRVPVTVTIARESGFSGVVQLTASTLPQGVSMPGIVIPADAQSVVVNLDAATNAPHSLPLLTEIRGSAGDLVRSVALTVTVRGAEGAVDTSYAEGKLTHAFSDRDDYVAASALQEDGKLVVVGRTTVQGRGTDFAVARYLRDGGLDPSFGTGGKVTTAIAEGTRTDDARAVAIDAQGRILVTGTSDQAGSGQDFALVRYLADGSLDGSFGTGGKVVTSFGAQTDRALAILIQPDGRIVLGGESNQPLSGLDFALARYNTDGSIDTSFGTAGKVLTPISTFGGKDTVNALTLQTVDGQPRIVAVGGEGDFVIARYRGDGQLDTAFGDGGMLSNLFQVNVGSANAVVVAPDGKLIVVGHAAQNVALLRLNVDGTPDATFGNAGRVVREVSVKDWDQATAVALQADGKILIGGWAFQDTGPRVSNFLLQRYTAAGQLDEGFAQGGTAITVTSPRAKDSAGRSLVLQADPRVPTVRAIAAGESIDGANDFAVVRFWL